MKTCENCNYAANVREFKGNKYAVCKHPLRPRGAIVSKINCEDWRD
jgi:hypothetical protein